MPLPSQNETTTSRLSIYYPVRPFHINQHFADNFPCVKDFGKPTQIILDGNAGTCPVGFEKLYSQWGMRGHNGTDLMAGVQPVYAVHSGTVVEQQTVPARGLGLGILTDEKVIMDCGTYYAKIRYWHLKSFEVKVGDKVRAGQLIGYTNNTGYSSGNHLHFELQPMDKDKGGHPKLVNPEGHIAGAVSIEPYFNGLYAEDIMWHRDLYYGVRGPDVKRLQKYLNTHGFPIAKAGDGSLGKETEYYGLLTQVAVGKYQLANSITPPAGYFGIKTRTYLNNLV